MQVYAIELRCQTQQQAIELMEQLEQQCIQTVEMGMLQLNNTEYKVRVEPYFGDCLDEQLLELLTTGTV